MKNLSPAPGIPTILNAFLQIYISIVLVIFSWTAIRIIRFPFGMDYGEAPLMDQARKLINGDNLYKPDFNSPPYTITNYPPLYPSLVAFTSFILKTPFFQTGRVLSLLFTAASGTIIGLFTYSITRQKMLAAFAAVLFLGNPYVLVWSSLARVDMMALAFSLAGLFILYRRKQSIAWLMAACVCFLVSIYTRQTYLLAAPLAGFVWLVSTHWRRSIIFLFIMGSLGMSIFGMINALTQGGFYNHIVLANINQYDISRTLIMIKQLFTFWPVVILASVGVFLKILRERMVQAHKLPTETQDNSFLLPGWGTYTAGAVITAMTIGKVGSDVNYFLELIAACSVLAVIAFTIFRHQDHTWRWIFTGFLSLQMIWVLIASIPITRMAIESKWENIEFYESLYRQIQQATQEGIVLSDDYLDMVVLAGQEIYYQPFEYGQLYPAGLWNPAELAEQVERKEFPLIVIGGDTVHKECCWPEPLANALDNSYQQEMKASVIILTPGK